VKRGQLLRALAAIAMPLRGARAQRRPRIGFLNLIAPNPNHPLAQALAEGLRERGLVAREQVAALALRHRLPGMHFSADYVRAGALMSNGTDLPAPYRRAAWFVARILAGVKPAELAAEQPVRFETAINLRTARALELKLPQRLLLQATEVIE
jgi:hypothetical protein